MEIHHKNLKTTLKDNADVHKRKKSFQGSIISHSFLAVLTKFINRFENFTEYETGLFVKSFNNWLDRKDILNTPKDDNQVKVGDICMMDWNVNYNPELSYIHPGLIIEDINNMISVLPVSSQTNFIECAYHETDSPNGNMNYWKVGTKDGFQKDCVLFLDGMKVISKTRIVGKISSLQCDLKDEKSLFRKLRWQLHLLYFPYEHKILHNQLNNTQLLLSKAEEDIKKLTYTKKKFQSHADKLNAENDKLKKDIKYLQEYIDKDAEVAYTIDE